MERTRGAALANLMRRAFDAMSDEVTAELSTHGHAGTTPTQHYAMEAIEAGAGDASALARRLGVTRQAAAKTIRSLEQLGYVRRGVDADDGRRHPLEVTDDGRRRTELGAAAYDRIRTRLEATEGAERIRITEEVLRAIADAPSPARTGASDRPRGADPTRPPR